MNRINGFAISLVCSATLFACGDDAKLGTDAAAPEPVVDAATDTATVPPVAVKQIDRSRFPNVGVEGSLDYATPEYWACRPDIDPNECHANLDATEVKPDGSLNVIPHVRAEHPAFDCFYVYPTVLLTGAPQMTDFTEAGIKLVQDPLLAQAARFSSICEVYAPLYRQVGLAGTAPAAGSSSALALQDVRDAFAYYLKNFNHGRKFVLMGHSQGTFMLSSLIQRDIDDKPALRSQLISALLLGGQPYTPPGQLVGGQFKNIPLCSMPDQAGCVVGFNSYAVEAPPGANAIFGRVGPAFANDPPDLTGQVACVNPAPLVGNQGRYAGSYFSLQIGNSMFGKPVPVPGVTTRFVLYKDLFRGSCVARDGLNYLQIAAEPPAGDTRPLPEYRNPVLEGVGFGMHLVDYNLALDDLIKLVQRQAAALK
jgi:pimeloyl-ACP methyl ester carboxylesterase